MEDQRLLFIDLWRLFTGRTTYAALGLKGRRRTPGQNDPAAAAPAE